MKLQQLSIFLENRPGRLSAPCEVLAVAGINISTLSLADTEQFGILRLIVQDGVKAQQLLQEQGWIVKCTEVLALEVEDRPGGLARVLKIVENAGLNIEYMYAFTARCNGRAVLVFRFDDPDAALSRLQLAGLNMIGDLSLFD